MTFAEIQNALNTFYSLMGSNRCLCLTLEASWKPFFVSKQERNTKTINRIAENVTA